MLALPVPSADCDFVQPCPKTGSQVFHRQEVARIARRAIAPVSFVCGRHSVCPVAWTTTRITMLNVLQWKRLRMTCWLLRFKLGWPDPFR